MLIGELIKRSGLTKDAIRFYEKKGLIHVDKKQRRPNNYKEYPEEVLSRLLLIKTIKEFGFTINEIDALFVLLKTEENVCGREDPFNQKILQIDNEIKRLMHLRAKLTSSMDKCRVGSCEFDKLIPSYGRGSN